MAGGEVGFLLEHVVVFGGLGGVLDLSDLRPLGLVGAHWGVGQRERPLDTGGQQHW